MFALMANLEVIYLMEIIDVHYFGVKPHRVCNSLCAKYFGIVHKTFIFAHVAINYFFLKIDS